METSIAGVVGFLEDNDSLIKQLMETAESAQEEIGNLSVEVDQAREEAKALIDQLGRVEFEIGKQDETKVRQKALLEAVGRSTSRMTPPAGRCRCRWASRSSPPSSPCPTPCARH